MSEWKEGERGGGEEQSEHIFSSCPFLSSPTFVKFPRLTASNSAF